MPIVSLQHVIIYDHNIYKYHTYTYATIETIFVVAW